MNGEVVILTIVLSLASGAQLAAAVAAIRLIRITGRPLAWSLIATALTCMTARRIIPLCLLLAGYPVADASLAVESLGLLTSLLMLGGMLLTSGIFKTIQRDRDALDLASQRLQHALVAGKVALWEWNIAAGTREWSSLVDDMLGFSPHGFPRSYRAWETRLHPDDLPGVQDAIRRNFEANAPYDVTYRIQRVDGLYVWWHEVGHVNRDHNGAPISLAGASVDISDRMQHEEEYTAIIQTAMDGFFVASMQTGRLLDVNNAYCRLVGYTRAELFARRIADLDLNETPTALTAHFQRIALAGRDQFETRHRCKDGRPVDVAISAQHLPNANRICIFVSDITERKRNESALRVRLAETERFNQLTTEREERMIELKQEINRLLQELGRPPSHVVTADFSSGKNTPAAPDGPAGEPTAPLPEPALQDLLDRRQMQELLESFSAAAGISASIVDLRGNILVGANWQPICTAFHRIHERTWARCVESDTDLAAKLTNGKSNTLFTCRNGLTMAAAPILVENRPLGHFFLSQFFLEPPDTAFFRSQAAEFNYDETAYLAALARVPVVPREKLEPQLRFLTSCASLAAKIAQERLGERQHENLARRTTAEMRHQREAAINLAQDAIEARRLLEASEEALRQSRDMLARILDTVPQCVFWKDVNSAYLGCNQPFARAFGLESPQEVVGKTDFDLIPSREEAEAYCADDRVVMHDSRPKRHVIEHVQCADGEHIWVDATKLPLVDKDGRVYGVLGIYEDISDRRQAEELLRQQETRLRFALETVGVGEWEFNLATLAARRSEQHGRIFGHEPPLPPWSLEIFQNHVIAEDRERMKLTVRDAIRLGRDLDFECQIVRRDGALRWIWVRGRHVWDDKGHPVRMAGIVLDITDRHQGENLIRQSKERLQLALIAIEDAIWDWTPAHNRLYWSPRLFSMLGYAPDEFSPSVTTWETLLHPDDQPAAVAMLQQCMDGRRDEYHLEVRYRTKSGDWHWVLVHGRVLARGLHNEIIRMAGTHTDISARKQNEELIYRQLQELQRWQTVMLGREQRVMELKREINALLSRLGEPARYGSAVKA
ncbi:MAG: PAS domain-containing protein [bacterium]